MASLSGNYETFILDTFTGSVNLGAILHCFNYFAYYFFVRGGGMQIYTEILINLRQQGHNGQFYGI